MQRYLPSFNGREERLVPRCLSPPGLRADNAKLRMVLALRRKLNKTLPVLSHERSTLRRRPTGRVRDREERECGAEEQSGVLRAGAAAQRVARLVRVVPDRGHDEIRAVDGDHARLREPRARVVLLHGRVHAHDRHEHAEREVEGDEEAVERAPGRGEERVEHAGERDRGDVHARRGADEDPLPEVRVGLFPVLEAGFGPGVREVDEEDKTEEDEDGSTDH